MEYRDKEFKFTRETKSAYYYGHKGENGTGVDKSDDGTVQKKVVLQKVSIKHEVFGETFSFVLILFYFLFPF